MRTVEGHTCDTYYVLLNTVGFNESIEIDVGNVVHYINVNDDTKIDLSTTNDCILSKISEVQYIGLTVRN